MMAKRKRKITEMTEKKNKKLKKASAKEMPPAATPGTGEAHAKGGAAWGAGQDTALELPELTPEEKRVLERKLKKERRKEERKQLRKAAVPSVPAKPSGAQLALDYLRGGTCGEVKSRVPAASPRPPAAHNDFPPPEVGSVQRHQRPAPRRSSLGRPSSDTLTSGPRSTRTGSSRRRGRPGCYCTCMTTTRFPTSSSPPCWPTWRG
ncbi:uncharacterized protein C7orf50 homolog isoform X3 [Panthera leo]|nr:uncharacterized protein C7orf50 homolog isoform X3 [Panthera leo]